MLLPSQIGNALGNLSITIMKALLVSKFKDETFKSQIFTNATSNRCWLTKNPHLQMLVLKAKICIWDWCGFCCQKVQLQVPTKTAAKSILSESAWTLMTRTKKTGLRVCQVLHDTYYRSRQQPCAAVWIGTSFPTSSGKETRKTKWCCMQTWRDFTFRSTLEEHQGWPSLETNPFHCLCHLFANFPLITPNIVLSIPEDIIIKDILQTCPSYGQSITSLPGSATDFPCLRPSWCSVVLGWPCHSLFFRQTNF